MKTDWGRRLAVKLVARRYRKSAGKVYVNSINGSRWEMREPRSQGTLVWLKKLGTDLVVPMGRKEFASSLKMGLLFEEAL